MSDSLQHYGILGMKWGVRRTPEQLGHVKKPKENQYGYIKGQSYDEDIKFPKGSVSYRVQAKPGLRDDAPVWVSYDKSDHLSNIATAIHNPDYGVATGSLNYETGEYTLYNLKLKAKEPIKAPSFTHAMEIFVEMVGDVGVKEINPYDPKGIAGKNFIKDWKKRKKGDGPTYAYTKFVDTMSRKSRSKFYEEFKQRLLDKGYNALVDPEDRPARKEITAYGEDYEFRKAPFVILDPKRTLEVEKQFKLTKADERYISRFYDLNYGDIEEAGERVKADTSRMKERYKHSHKRWEEILKD